MIRVAAAVDVELAGAAGDGVDLVTGSALSAVLSASVSRVFRVASETEDWHTPGHLSMSGLAGPCSRRSAFSLAQMCAAASKYNAISDQASAVRPTDEKRAAWLGTWLHAELVPRLAAVLREAGAREVLTEHDVVLDSCGMRLPGRLDLAACSPVGAWSVLDVKTVGPSRFRKLSKTGPERGMWVQVFGYSEAMCQAGRVVDEVAVILVDRDTGADSVFVREFGPAERAVVHEQVGRLLEWSADPLSAPAEPMGHSWMGWVCAGCPFASRCPGGERGGLDED